MKSSINEIANKFLELYHDGNHHVLDAFEFILRKYWHGLSLKERLEKLKDERFKEIAYILDLDSN